MTTPSPPPAALKAIAATSDRILPAERLAALAAMSAEDRAELRRFLDPEGHDEAATVKRITEWLRAPTNGCDPWPQVARFVADEFGGGPNAVR